jgi:predicted SAM-dependent methyltransferase
MKKLHLGCGKRYLLGFTHIDIEPHENVDVVSDIGDLSFIESNSVSEIYASHALEYYDRFQVNDVLREWNRVLVPGGTISVTVPDLESLIGIYMSTQNLETMIGPLFGRWKNEKNNETIYHKTVWDLQSLSSKLIEEGFCEVETFDPVEYLFSIDPNYDDYSLAFFPHMDRSGIQVSLALRGKKKTV